MTDVPNIIPNTIETPLKQTPVRGGYRWILVIFFILGFSVFLFYVYKLGLEEAKQDGSQLGQQRNLLLSKSDITFPPVQSNASITKVPTVLEPLLFSGSENLEIFETAYVTNKKGYVILFEANSALSDVFKHYKNLFNTQIGWGISSSLQADLYAVVDGEIDDQYSARVEQSLLGEQKTVVVIRVIKK